VLFNSAPFLLWFLPCALVGYFGLGRHGTVPASLWLVAASLFFYGWSDPSAIPILVLSILGNYGLGRLLGATHERPVLQAWVCRVGIAVNLAALGYYKYFAGLLGLAGAIGLLPSPIPAIALPLGISFFTFTQIGYLLDVRDGTADSKNFLEYTILITFFPHLIAGPILQHREIMPQLAAPGARRISMMNLSVGAGIFIIGLAKKTLLADPSSIGVDEAFSHPEALTLFVAWHAALSYSLQLYFDFSGYSDMAIGLARMFNLSFPLNFDSPYKARSIIDYWQRWHMTLTRFLTRHIYTPLSLAVMRRRAARRQAINQTAQKTWQGFAEMIALPVFVTIGLAGIWHGSGAQFLAFGLLHASFLTANRAWRIWFGASIPRGRLGVVWRVSLTYLCVLVGSIFFRTGSVSDALTMLTAMLGSRGFGPGLPVPAWLAERSGGIGWLRPADPHAILRTAREVAWLAGLYVIVWGMPNTQQIFARARPALEAVVAPTAPWLVWRPNLPWALVLGGLATLGLLSLGGTGEFLYFQF
jgi:D-alanyl-lipoteichoic acid acyltransferase DltB (MBOAT superfamily)